MNFGPNMAASNVVMMVFLFIVLYTILLTKLLKGIQKALGKDRKSAAVGAGLNPG